MYSVGYSTRSTWGCLSQCKCLKKERQELTVHVISIGEAPVCVHPKQEQELTSTEQNLLMQPFMIAESEYKTERIAQLLPLNKSPAFISLHL